MGGLDLGISSILLLDGITNGTVYALLAIALVLLFAVTRVIFVPQGDFVAYGALTLAMFQLGKLPGTVWLLLALAVLAAAMDLVVAVRRGDPAGRVVRAALRTLLPPAIAGAAAWWAVKAGAGIVVQGMLSVAVVTLLGPLLYRVAYQRLADASVLVLLIVSVGVHFALTGLGLAFFGAEGFRNPSFWDATFALGPVILSGQMVVVFATSIVLVLALVLFFERTLRGKALRATAVNRLGARLMGISTEGAGRLSFAVAAFIGALSGLLIGPVATLYYDSGFLIGLKGFVAAIFGGLVSYPAAALGALLVGVVESFSSFLASSFKEVIVFAMVLPVLAWLSLRHGHDEDEEQ